MLSRITGLEHFVYAKMRDFEGGGYGIAILSRYPIEEYKIFHYHDPNLSVVLNSIKFPLTFVESNL